MLILLRVAGIIIAVMGVIYLLAPKMIKKYVDFWGKRILVAGVLNIVIGILFLLANSACRIPTVIIVIGVIALLKGIVIFVLGQEKMKVLLEWWGNRPPAVVRLMGLIVIAFGILLLYAV